MSRIGRMPITIPKEVKISVQNGDVKVSGPRGELQRQFNPDMIITTEGDTLVVTRPRENRTYRSLHGLTRTLLANMVTGVSTGFEKNLEIVGVGFRGEMQGDRLILRVGFSHTVEVKPLPGITIALDSPTKIKVTGNDKEVVGEMAAEIRAIHPPDKYKGKGIRYAGEPVRLKPGKAGKAMGKK